MHFQQAQRLRIRLLIGGGAAIGLFAVVYLLLLYQGVAATAELRYARRVKDELQQRQQEFETRYLTAVAVVDLARAPELGLVRIEAPQFVIAGGETLAQADIRPAAAR
ncbi:MAG: hypothetical protein HYU35_02325 [Parcubacteria group bacterium]|nr:hypothetical protein [Parcubacteria group bacterium]